MDGDAPAKCTRTNKDGRPCSAQAWRDGQCRWHHPALEGERQAGRRKGGVGKSSKARARKQLPAGMLTVDELRGVVGITIAKVLGGSIEPPVAQAVASLARAYGSLTEAARLEELTERLDAIEATTRRGGAA